MPIDDEFISGVKKVVRTLGNQSKVGELCGVEASAISSIIHGRIQSASKPLHRRLTMLIGKSKKEIEAIEDELIVEVRKENEIQEREELERKAQIIKDREDRIESIKLGKSYRVTFLGKDEKFNRLTQVLEGIVVEISDRFFLLRGKYHNFTVSKVDIAYEFVQIKELE